jgi:phosphate transport system permease protein
MSRAVLNSQDFPPQAEPSHHPTWLNGDRVLHGLSLAAAMTIVAMLAALIAVLIYGAAPSIRAFGLRFLYTSAWRTTPSAVVDPMTRKVLRDSAGHAIRLPGQTYGALAVIYGTAATSLIALLLATPLSFAAAIFLCRIAPRWLASPVSFLIEFLAAIPSLAYGLWGMFVLRPMLANHFEPIFGRSESGMARTGNDLLAGGLILAIMILPIVTAVSRDVLNAVPREQIEGVIALGATWWQSCKEMLKFGRSGLLGAVTLGLARAAGETIAVTMVIGITTQIRPSLFAPAQTMASLLAVSFGEVSHDLEKSSLVEVALILLLMSLLFNLAARYLVLRSKP